MRIDAEQLITELGVIQLRAHAIALSIASLEADAVNLMEQVRKALIRKETPTGPIETAVTGPDCKCPANQRVAAAVSGHPTRTKCRLCQREFE